MANKLPPKSPETEEPKRRMIKPPEGGAKSGRGIGHTALKTAYKRTLSSQKWLERQLNDPYVVKAKQEGWRSRAAFKFIEIDDRFHLVKKGVRVVDLGCAPGGWIQVALKRGAARVCGIDLLPVDPIDGADLIQGDFTDENISRHIIQFIGDKPDLILSDLAHNTVGHKETDHLKIMGLIEVAIDFACINLKTGGAFVAKAFQGGATSEVLHKLKLSFTDVKHMKPKSSRTDSSEIYIIALGFKG